MSIDKNSPLILKWDKQTQNMAGAERADELRAAFEQADKDRREYASAMMVMAGLYSEGKPNELLTAIKVIETVSIRALAIAEIALKSAFAQPTDIAAEATDERR